MRWRTVLTPEKRLKAPEIAGLRTDRDNVLTLSQPVGFSNKFGEKAKISK